MRKRNNLVQIWLSDEELGMLNRRSAKSGLSRAAYVRRLIHNLQPRDLPPPDFRTMARQLYYCSNALNQIARKANALNVIDAQKYDEAVHDLREAIVRIERAVLAPEKLSNGDH